MLGNVSGGSFGARRQRTGAQGGRKGTYLHGASFKTLFTTKPFHCPVPTFPLFPLQPWPSLTPDRMPRRPRDGVRDESLDFTRGEKLAMLRRVMFQSVRQPSQTASQTKGAGTVRRRRKAKKVKTQKAAPPSALERGPAPRDEVSPPLARRTRLVSQRRGGPETPPNGKSNNDEALGNGTLTGTLCARSPGSSNPLCVTLWTQSSRKSSSFSLTSPFFERSRLPRCLVFVGVRRVFRGLHGGYIGA